MQKTPGDTDLAFMYADPLVTYDESVNAYKDYTVPLDLEAEYNQIVGALRQLTTKTNRRFCISREVMNSDNLKNIVAQKPKILHISCHGGPDLSTGNFYLSIEKKGSACEDKLDSVQLGKVLGITGKADSLRCVFVSACHSEQISKVFLDAGVPAVIAVNANNKVKDDACRFFAEEFYWLLLKGQTIRNAFQQARDLIATQYKEMMTCCCSHEHEPDCPFGRKYKENPDEAHKKYCKPCLSCKCDIVDGRRYHDSHCTHFQQCKHALQQMREEYAQQNPVRPRKSLKKSATSKMSKLYAAL